MRRRRHLPGALVALMALTVTLSCDSAQRGSTPLEPQAASDLIQLSGLSSQPPANLNWITETDPGELQFASKLIGILGGELVLDEHAVDVPKGSVLQLTLFTAYAPSTSVIDVDLNAYVGNLLGGALRLLGLFEKPVTLELSYARATNVSDPDKLVIVRLLDDGGYEILPTIVDKQKKTVRAKLDHFSKYAMASN